MIKSYEDLEVYQNSYSLGLRIHKITHNFPEHERYEVGRQLRKAAFSIPLNIAEGYGKKESKAEFKRFLRMSLGSCNEVQVLIDMSKDLQYINEETHQKLKESYNVLGRRLNTLIAKWT
jgi:four helix bundle protein